MTRKVFTYTFALGVLVLVICTAVFFGMQYKQTVDETYAALEEEASYAASGLKAGGIEYLKSLDNTNRVTWIDSDGSVLYDSEYPDLKANQSEFLEVKLALEEGRGKGIRRSSSGGKRTMYYAFLCEDGTVLRLSRSLSAVRTAFVAVSPVPGVILLVMLISASMAFRIARSISKPVNEMNLDDLSNASPYQELEPLVERLQEQKEIIETQAVEREQMRRETFEQQTREHERQAREQEQMRREFTANVSHELKTPLTSISGFAELMRSGLCDEEKMIEFAGDIYRESQRLIALVNDIIRISELDEGAVQTAFEKVDLANVVNNVVKSLQPAADRHHIEVSVEKSSPVYVMGSQHLIDEMIYNLCDNAIKYNHEGGSVIVRIGTEETAGQDADEVKKAFVTVEDTGIGIPAAEQERVFERFYRVDKSHSRQMGGTGLGLSIVKHGARFHDASIDMESTPGSGTKITIRFLQAE